jgi:haloalkane dehalogenase
MAALAGEPLRLVAPDLVGLGFSDRPRHASEHTLENHARWLGAAIDALDLDGLVLVLHDWGGPIGMRAMADRPGRVSGLVLLNTVVGPPRPGFRPTTFHRLAHVPVVSTVLFRAFAFPERLLHRTQGDPRSIAGDVARAYRFPLRGISRNAAPLALARMAPDSLDHPSVAPLRRCQSFVEGFTGPSAIVWGDRDPILGRVRSWVEKLLPGAPVTRTGAGHFLQEEVPDEIAAAIRRVAAAP